QPGHHRAEALLHGLQLDFALAHATVDHRGHQGFLIQLQVRENLGDLEARLETGRTLGPDVLRSDGLLLGVAGELASLFEYCAIEHRVEADDMVQPRLEVDAAVGIDRLLRSHLYHLAYLPYDVNP